MIISNSFFIVILINQKESSSTFLDPDFSINGISSILLFDINCIKLDIIGNL